MYEVHKASVFATADQMAQFGATEAALAEAPSLAPEHAGAHFVLGHLYIQTNRAIQGIAECERALVLDRNLAAAHAMVGFAKIRIGRGKETEAHVQAALRLSPRDTSAYIWMGVAALAKLLLGIDEEALERANRSVELNRNCAAAHFYRAAALAQLGRQQEAQAAIRTGVTLDPAFTISRYRNFTGAVSDYATYLTQRERVIEGLRKAGVPE